MGIKNSKAPFKLFRYFATLKSMEKLLVFFCIISMCTGTFFTSQTSSGPEAYNLCIYSKDPTQYSPKCFMCPTIVYPSALMACVNGTTMPSNITYSSANCIEKNCAINYPKAEAVSSSKSLWIGMLDKLIRPSRSVHDNTVEVPAQSVMDEKRLPNSDWKIIANVQSYASDMGMDVDYSM